jgi:hypothetical protein
MLVALLTAGLFVPLLFAEETPKTPDVIHFSKLIPLLPAPPEGWIAEEPNGATSEAGGFKISTAGRSYRQGDSDDAPTASITILDSAASKEYQQATLAGWEFSNETTEGYDKAVNIDGMRGFEHYENETKSGMLWVLVANRYFVQIECSRLDPKELHAWLKRMDLKKLAALK